MQFVSEVQFHKPRSFSFRLGLYEILPNSYRVIPPTLNRNSYTGLSIDNRNRRTIKPIFKHQTKRLFLDCSIPFLMIVFVCLFFLGLNDRAVEGEFLWSDRSAVEYINWDKLNSDYSWRSKDCASVKKDNDGRWRDQSCFNSFSYICKKPKGL